ncbi:hypothetical protein HYH03_001930 [Edaphochlamys debaryana]|uniref:Uncharacterized protein n=1 Tax=Edaphochlamys debaryana TaxID=47281 RepID=A0A835YD08_9CHLO|nr:hypothetical protein HYH03_001930 [Edaphochlamys debaryana]|eukprot:KAG2500356.1 hypothetical protein HYH03_001930 [Edaphochlamys debaryana]
MSLASRPAVISRVNGPRVCAIAAPLPGPAPKASSNGGGPKKINPVQATMEDINKALAACIKEAASSSSLEKINKGIGKEISKAAFDRFKST